MKITNRGFTLDQKNGAASRCRRSDTPLIANINQNNIRRVQCFLLNSPSIKMHAVCCPVTTTPTSHCTTMQDGVWKPTATVSRPNCCCCMSNGLWQKIPILSLCVYVRALHPTPPTGFTPTALHVSVRLCVCVRRPFRLQGNVRGEAVVLNSMRKEYISHRVTRSDCSALRFTRHASHVDMCDSILRTHAWNEATPRPSASTWASVVNKRADMSRDRARKGLPALLLSVL